MLNPISVPATFFGLASQDWPVRGVTSGGNGSHAPYFSFGAYTTYGCSALHWGNLNPSDGVYSWTAMDTLVTQCRAVGCNSGIYVQEGTPAWLAQPGQAAIADPWGILGGGSFPTDLSKLAAFMTAFAVRNRDVWGGFFTEVSILNEPELNSFSGSTVGGWWGTAAQFVDYMKTCRDAVKAVSPSIPVGGPGTYSLTVAATWLAAQGSATGAYGWQCIDFFSSHPYWAVPNKTVSGRGDLDSLPQGGAYAIRKTLEPYGLQSLPIYITEYGIDSGGSKASPTPTVAAFLAIPAADRRKYLARLLVSSARNGYKTFCGWSYGGPELTGDLADDVNGVVAGYQDAYTAMAGKTIIAGGWYSDGREWLSFSDGSTYTV